MEFVKIVVFVPVTYADRDDLSSVSEIVDATVFFKNFSDEAIEDMIEKGDALKCAGAFNVADPYVTPYVERIDGTIEGVMGLSVEVVTRLLKEAE